MSTSKDTLYKDNLNASPASTSGKNDAYLSPQQSSFDTKQSMGKTMQGQQIEANHCPKCHLDAQMQNTAFTKEQAAFLNCPACQKNTAQTGQFKTLSTSERSERTIAVTPETMNVSVTPSPMNVSVTPQAMDVSVTPQPLDVSVAPLPVNLAVAPLPLSVDIAPLPVNVGIAPLPINVAVAPMPVNVGVAPMPVNVSVAPVPVNVSVSKVTANVSVSPVPVNVSVTKSATANVSFAQAS